MCVPRKSLSNDEDYQAAAATFEREANVCFAATKVEIFKRLVFSAASFSARQWQTRPSGEASFQIDSSLWFWVVESKDRKRSRFGWGGFCFLSVRQSVTKNRDLWVRVARACAAQHEQRPSTSRVLLEISLCIINCRVSS